MFKRKSRYTVQFLDQNSEILMPECFVKISERPGLNLIGDSEGIRYYPTEMTVSQFEIPHDQHEGVVAKIEQTPVKTTIIKMYDGCGTLMEEFKLETLGVYVFEENETEGYYADWQIKYKDVERTEHVSLMERLLA